MSFIRRFFMGIVVCVAGFGAIVFGIEQMPETSGDPMEKITAPSVAGAPSGGAEAPAPSTPSSTPPSPPSGDLGHAANGNLRTNNAGLQIIKESEGLRLESYQAGGRWYVGYGHSATARAGMTITEADADRLLREDIRDAEAGVRRLVTVAVNENEFSAMVSLAYNLGVGGFGRTVVLERINRGDRKGAADGFLQHNKAGGKVVEHLTHRREKERALFLTPA